MLIRLISIAVILLAILSIFAFYSLPLVKVNSLLICANKSDTIPKIDDSSFISQDNYNKLRIVDRCISEDEYVNLKTRKKYDFVDLKNIDITCSVKATIDSFEEIVSPDVYTKDLKISISFIDNKWIVSNVDIID